MTSPDNIKELRELLAAKDRAFREYAADPSSLNWHALYDPTEAVKNAAMDALPGLLDEVEALRADAQMLGLDKHNLFVRAERAEAENARLQRTRVNLRSAIDDLHDERSALLARCKGLEDRLSSAETSRNDAQSAYYEQKARCEELEADMAELKEFPAVREILSLAEDTKLAATRTTGGDAGIASRAADDAVRPHTTPED